jgi:dephospho-CoA kinase
MKRQKKNRLIICLTGMPGAGKSTVAQSLKEKGFSMVVMGNVIREEAKRRNLEPTDSNLGNLMLKLRKRLGSAAVAHLILRKIEREGINNNIVIDGIRSVSEVRLLEAIGRVKLLAIHASTNTRFRYIKERGRRDVPSNIHDFIARDKRELTVGISEAIALADETLSNNNLTVRQLKLKAFAIIQKWINEINDSDDTVDKTLWSRNN